MKIPIVATAPLVRLKPISRVSICAGFGGNGVEVFGIGELVMVGVIVGDIVSSGAGVVVGLGVLVSIAE